MEGRKKLQTNHVIPALSRNLRHTPAKQKNEMPAYASMTMKKGFFSSLFEEGGPIYRVGRWPKVG